MSYEAPQSCSKTVDAIEDLDTLLDDALGDFEKSSVQNLQEAVPSHSNYNATAPDPDVPLANTFGDDLRFRELFDNASIHQVTKEFSGMLEELTAANPDLISQFQEFGASAAVASASGSEMPSIDENVSRAISELAKNFQEVTKLEGQGPGDALDENILKAMSELNMGTDASSLLESAQGNMDGLLDSDTFMNMMQGMMKNLLSKELLYPSLCEIRQRYPAWLTANASHPDFSRYQKQNAIVLQLCSIFEEEKDDDCEITKKKRIGKVMELMQQMQQFGQPPADMMADVVGDASAGSEELPPVCSLM